MGEKTLTQDPAEEVGSDAAVIRSTLLRFAGLVGRVARDLATPTAVVAAEAIATLREGGTLFFCGNGGSAADAQHLATEYMVRFSHSRRPLRAIALTTDTSLLTAAGNDLGFSEIFARQIEGLAREGDMLFLHSTSGESENLLAAAATAQRLGVKTAALLAKGGGRLEDAVDHALVVPTSSTPHAQEIHLALGHMICDLVERAFPS